MSAPLMEIFRDSLFEPLGSPQRQTHDCSDSYPWEKPGRLRVRDDRDAYGATPVSSPAARTLNRMERPEPVRQQGLWAERRLTVSVPASPACASESLPRPQLRFPGVKGSTGSTSTNTNTNTADGRRSTDNQPRRSQPPTPIRKSLDEARFRGHQPLSLGQAVGARQARSLDLPVSPGMKQFFRESSPPPRQ
eukprot:scaffold53240_cov32-Prasinocladus_malaysianus.AAC.1